MFRRYGASDIRQLLDITFTATTATRPTKFSEMELNLPYFYVGTDAIIFPPVSDLDGSINLETISTALINATELLKEGNHLSKKLIFPVAEEQPIFWGIVGKPRDHWVTLCYDPLTQTATLIDSRSQLVSSIYSTIAMKNLLITGLNSLNLHVLNFDIRYQGIQEDHSRCGAWTAVNIELLANGKSVDGLLQELTAKDRDNVVSHNQKKINTGKNNGVYQPGNSDSDTQSLDSETTDEDCDFPDDTNIPSGQATTWVETATQLIENTLQNPNALIIALIARESITYQGAKLSDQILDQFSAEEILNSVDPKNQHDGFGIYDPSRLGSGLRMVGFDNKTINTLTLPDILKYDAIISSAINNAGNETFYANRMLYTDCEEKLMEIRAEHEQFKMTLFISLKRQIEMIIQGIAEITLISSTTIEQSLSTVRNKIKKGQQITIEFKDSNNLAQLIFIDAAKLFSSQRQQREIISLIQSTLKSSGSNGNLVINIISPQQGKLLVNAVKPRLNLHLAKQLIPVTKQELYSELAGLQNNKARLIKPINPIARLEQPIKTTFFNHAIKNSLPELRTMGNKYSFLAEFDALISNVKNEMTHINEQSPACRKVNADMKRMFDELIASRNDFYRNKNDFDFEQLHEQLSYSLNKCQNAINIYPERSTLEWLSEKIHNLIIGLSQLVNKYLLGKANAPAHYLDSKAMAEQLVTECTNKTITFKDQIHTLFAVKSTAHLHANFTHESSDLLHLKG